MCKISVIVPVYNVERFLRECIESIISQTYKDLEIILVNDGSTDKSPLICEEYKKIDARVIVLHKENGGLSDARNKGIDISTGEYIGFVDSDDFIENDMYELLLNNIKKVEADIATCGVISEKVKDKNFYKEEIIVNAHDGLKEMLMERSMNTSACDKLYKRSLFDEIRYPKDKLYEDLYTTYKLLHKANKIVISNQKKYYYRYNENSITKSKFNKNKMDLIVASKEIINFMEDNYPDLAILARNRCTRYAISFIKTIIQENIQDKLILQELISLVRANIFIYLFSSYKISSKLYGVSLSVSYRITYKITKFLNI